MQENDTLDETANGKSNFGYQMLGAVAGSAVTLLLLRASSPIPWSVAIDNSVRFYCGGST